MESEVHSPGFFGPSEDDDATAPSAVFQFCRVDGFHRFLYTVGGTVDQTVTFGGGGCSGSGDGSASMARWGQDSGLISRDLTSYQAVLRASLGPPFQVTYTCPDSPMPVSGMIRFKDLLTETSAAGGPVPMRPKARVLSDHGNLGAVITITYTWHLVADVP